MTALINDRFILLPSHINLTRERLHYRDLLTYITIRSFNNENEGICTPTYDKIVERSGMSRKFISKSIKRLQRSGYLEVTRSSTRRACNQYSLQKVLAFSPIPHSIFAADDLTANQRAMLITLRQFFDSISLELYVGNLASMAKLLDVSYKTIYTQYVALVASGYIEEVFKTYKSRKSRKIIRLSEKLNWK
jgi:DNA-binding MarR family transcriptional regulator